MAVNRAMLSPSVRCSTEIAARPLQSGYLSRHRLHRAAEGGCYAKGHNGALLEEEKLRDSFIQSAPEAKSGLHIGAEEYMTPSTSDTESQAKSEHLGLAGEAQLAEQDRQTSKPCKRCGEAKPFSDFLKSSLMADGHDYYCKTCRNSIYLGAKHSEQDTAEERTAEMPEGTKRRVTHKVCRLCGHNKSLEDFMPNRRLADGRDYYCRPCRTNPWEGAHSRGL